VVRPHRKQGLNGAALTLSDRDIIVDETATSGFFSACADKTGWQAKAEHEITLNIHSRSVLFFCSW